MLFKKIKDYKWFPYTIAACIAVLFWFILVNLGVIAGVIGKIVKVCIPVIVGIIIAYVLDPVCRFFERLFEKKIKSKRIARYTSVILTLIIILALFASLVAALIPQLYSSIMGIVSKLEVYRETLYAWLDTLKFDVSGIEEGIDSLFSGLNNYVPKIIDIVIQSYQNVGGMLFNGLVSAILSVYFLFGKEHAVNGTNQFIKFMLGDKKYNNFMHYAHRCNEILTIYITGSIIEAMAVGLVNAICMLVFGMPYIIVVSVVVGVTNLAPTFGPLVGGVIGFFLLFMEKPLYGIIFVIFTLAIQTVDGYIVKPKLFGGTLGVSSIWVLISIIVLGKLFGVVGVLISIPLAAMIQILLRDIITLQVERRRRRKGEVTDGNIYGFDESATAENGDKKSGSF